MSKTDNHRKVYINKDGEEVLRVTEVIRILAKDQLLVWSNMLGLSGIRYKDELTRTGNIGSLFHAVVEDYFTPNTLGSIDFSAYGVYSYTSQLEATNAIKSFFKWYEKNRSWFIVVFREKVVVGKKLGGTIDCGIRGIKDPKKVIFVDYKTSPDFYLTQFLQLAGYVDIYEEVYGPNTVEGVMVILANKKGKKARSMFIPRENMDLLISCFNNLLYTAIATKHLENVWVSLGQKTPIDNKE